MPQENAGNTTDAGIKLVTIPQDGNLIAKNPAVTVGRITSRPRESSTPPERSFSLAGRTLEERHTQLSDDSVDSLLFLHSGFDDKFYTWSSQFLTGYYCICLFATLLIYLLSK